MRVVPAKNERFPEVCHPYCELATMNESKNGIINAFHACERATALNPDFHDARTILERLDSRALPEDGTR